MNNTIPVIFAIDEKYTIPLTVTLVSLLENANEDTHYNIFVLTDNEFPTESKDTINLLTEHYNNCTINIITFEHEFDTIEFKYHFSKAICYRLMLSSLLPNIDKCIYLDCDIIVQKDLVELYNTDVSDYYLAGVKDIGVIEALGQKHADLIGIKDISQYINSGVLVFNLDKIRKDGIQTKFLALAYEKQFDYLDQDVFNSLCYNNIKHIQPKYNSVASWFRQTTSNEITYSSYISKYFTDSEMSDAINNNVILHYTTQIKPWTDKYSTFSEIWWKYYELSPLFKANLKIIKKFYKGTQLALGNIIDKQLSVYKENMVVLYGISSYTKIIYDLMHSLGININFICDENKSNWDNTFEEIPIISPLKLKQLANKKRNH